MKKIRRIKIGLFVLVSFCGVTYADNFEIKLGSGDAFEVQDSSGTSLMDVLSSGNVGIGTTSPIGQLHLNNTVGLDHKIWFTNADTGVTTSDGFAMGQNNSEQIYFANLENTDMYFTTNNKERVRITNAGNVGIGTTAPAADFHLRRGGDATLAIDGYFASTLSLRRNLLDNWFLERISMTNDLKLHTSASLVGETGAGDVMFWDYDTGNVGIGTTAPVGKLDVNGTIYQRGGQLHADYVFESDYALESIRDHADFMWKNKHLKSIPKAKVDENGMEIVEVGSHRKGIVEELEKAHIYISRLEERLAKLETMLNAR